VRKKSPKQPPKQQPKQTKEPTPAQKLAREALEYEKLAAEKRASA